ncbi:MAG: hypothetical protein DRI46_14060 [Chloroflexi bacterium]|nr:MAG: hypothetical protein DRI46_14060 [Chloroflexota bacterium]
MHTEQFKFPRKIIFAFGAIIFLLAVGGYMLSQSIIFNGVDNLEVATIEPLQKTALLYNEQNWGDVETKVPLQGCISSATECICYSTGGAPLQISTAECLKHMQHIIPQSINIGSGSERQPRRADRVSFPL